MRGGFMLALGLTAFLASHLDAQVDKDARLKIKGSLRLKCCSLQTLVETLKAETKVSFRVQPNISNRKITIIFHDRPWIEALKAIESDLFLEWHQSGDGYLLALPPRIEREEQAKLQSEQDECTAAIESELDQLSNWSGKPKAEADLRLHEISQELQKLKNDPSPQAELKRETLLNERQCISSPTGKALNSVNLGDIRKTAEYLVGGGFWAASSRPQDGVPALPTGFMDGVLSNFPTAAGAIALFRYQQSDQTLQGRMIISEGVVNRGNSVTGLFTFEPMKFARQRGRRAPILDRLAKFDARADDGVLSKLVDHNKPLAEDPGYFNRAGAGWTLAEQLEYLADHADVPVVADAFRIYCSEAAPLSGFSVKDYLSQLKASHPPRSSTDPGVVSHISTENRWVMARHDGYWRRLEFEIPEDVIASLERSPGAKQPTLDQYATFAGKLTQPQCLLLATNSYRVALRFDSLPIQKAMTSLRLWSMLSAGQKQTARTSGLELKGLPPAMVTELQQGWGEKLWVGEISASLWGMMFSPKAFAAAHPTLFYRDTNAQFKVVEAPTRRAIGRSSQSARPGRQGGLKLEGSFEYDFSDQTRITDPFFVPQPIL